MIRSAKALLLVVSLALACVAQTPPTTSAPEDKAGAYYHFAMGRLYAELAAAEGNRDYANRAIQHYQDAIKADPSASLIFEELTDLYIQANRLADAVVLAEDLLKANPKNLDARRMLGRVYLRLASGNTQQGKTDESFLRKAIEQFQQVTAQDPKDVESWVTLGRLYRAAGNSPDAEKALDSALQVEPENEDALTALAMMYSDLGDTTKAVEKLKALTEKNPSERTLAILAAQYEQMNDYKSAVEVLRRALALAPDDERLQRGLAQDLLESGKVDESLEAYQQLAADNPREAIYPLRMSLIFRIKHDLGKAAESLAKAKTLDPESLEMRDEEINLFEAQGKTDQAIAALKSLLDDTQRRNYTPEVAATRATLLQHLGRLYRDSQQYPQAVDVFRQMAPLDAGLGPRSSVEVIETYRNAKDTANALKEADAAVKKFPKDRMVVAAHATVLADQGKIDPAASELRGLLTGDRHDREIHLELFGVYERAKRFADASKSLDDAEKVSSSNEEKANIAFRRGAMLERQKKFDAAEAAFRKVLEIDPNDAGALNYLGYMLADRSVRLDEAAQLIKKAVDLEPNNGAYLDSLGWVYYRQGKLVDAQDLLQHALDLMQDPTVHDHLGDVYSKLGKTKEAVAQWQASIREFQKASPGESDPEEVAKVNKKLDEAQAKLAKETRR